jgi:hypothetical protein
VNRIIAFFNLRPGVSEADYEAWAREADLATVRRLKSVAAFNVYRSVALIGSDESPPFRYFEVLDVSDLALMGAEAAEATMQSVVARFHELADNPQLVLVEDIETRHGHA